MGVHYSKYLNMLLLLLPLFLCPSVLPSFPLVTWHGIGGSASECNDLISTVKLSIPDVHVLNVAVGPDPEMDHANSVLMRGLVQRCPVPVRTLITFGAPHQGEYGVPDCVSWTGSYELCELVRQLLSLGAYEPWIQDLVTPAQYWHDPFNQTNYLEGSHFLSVVNNEKEDKIPEYRDRMVQLENFVMIMFEGDTTIIPKESSMFEFYVPGQDEDILPLEESLLYKEDWIGLKYLNEEGKLHFYTVPGHHVQMDYQWIAENIVPYLV